jgi:hypothetical protein
MADFSAWDQDTLQKFASEAQLKLLQQEQEIQHLKDDLRVAIQAYRALMQKPASPGGQ